MEQQSCHCGARCSGNHGRLGIRRADATLSVATSPSHCWEQVRVEPSSASRCWGECTAHLHHCRLLSSQQRKQVKSTGTRLGHATGFAIRNGSRRGPKSRGTRRVGPGPLLCGSPSQQMFKSVGHQSMISARPCLSDSGAEEAGCGTAKLSLRSMVLGQFISACIL